VALRSYHLDTANVHPIGSCFGISWRRPTTVTRLGNIADHFWLWPVQRCPARIALGAPFGVAPLADLRDAGGC
jgi:hypothetical protein